jgi:hypothetical protein
MREPRYPLPRVVTTYKLDERADAARTRFGSLAQAAPLFVLGSRAARRAGPRRRGGGSGVEDPSTAPPVSYQTRSLVALLEGFDNDPSAGSPTETLLRLLLPLNDKVQWTSRDVAGSEPPASPRSEHFTGPFNR